MKYPMLGEKFCKWFEEEYESVWAEWYGTNIPKSMLKDLNMSADEYFDKFIRPYLSLTNEQLIMTLDILASRLKDKLTPQPSPFCLSYKLVINPKINALDWLLVHIADLKYFEFNDFVQSKYEKPYKQCLVCGKPDYYEIKSFNGIKEKHYFSHKNKYCHKDGCMIEDANPQEHAEGCHYKEWAYIKKSMNQKLSRTLARIKKLHAKSHNIHYDYAENLNQQIEDAEKEFYQIFEDFYLEQYRKNCKILYTVRSSEDDEIFDLREF